MNTNESEVMVTVWCLAYNHERYIRKTLEGFVSQKTNFRFQVLVHDDASTDNTQSIIREFEEKYPDIIKPIYQTENQYKKGVNKLSTFLVPNIKGKYVAFCEGDDYWCDDTKLQQQYDIMEADPDIYMCTHKVQCINEDGSLNERTIPEDSYGLTVSGIVPKEKIANMLWCGGGYPFHTCSYFLKRETLNLEKYRTICPLLNGDQAMMRLALHFGKIYYIDKTFSCRRLMSKGNWNSIFNGWSEERKTTYFTNYINGEIAYDKMSGGAYHKYITICYYSFLSSQRISRENALKLHEVNKENYSFSDLTGFKQKLKWILFRYCYGIFKAAKKLAAR